MQKTSNPTNDKSQHEKELAEAILEYLVEHPQASDTLDGIAEWWIMRQQVRVDVNTLVDALQRLTKNGLLQKIGEGDSALYHVKTELRSDQQH